MRKERILRELLPTLKHRITIRQRSSAADGAGGFTFSWSDLATVWAAVKQVSAGEELLQERVAQRASYRFYIRFRSDITHDDRIKYDGREFSILTITDVENMGIMLEIIARVES